jgi:hypothetical protein
MNPKREGEYRRSWFDMGLNEVAKMRVVFEPLVMFFIGKPLIPEATTTPR